MESASCAQLQKKIIMQKRVTTIAMTVLMVAIVVKERCLLFSLVSLRLSVMWLAIWTE